MSKKQITNIIIFFFLLIGGIHFSALEYSLYWRFFWLDMPMHFMGGVFAGFVGLAFYFFTDFFREPKKERTHILLVSLASVIVIGGAWEVYEYLTGNTYNFLGNYPLDIFKDVLFDILGGYVASLYFIWKEKVVEENKIGI